MENMTLRELCKELDISRRVVQRYEEKGIVVPSKNERGYLIYDKKTQDKIKWIRFYQQLGFEIREIKWLLDAPRSKLKEILEKQVKKLKEDKIQLDGLIEKAQKLIDEM